MLTERIGSNSHWFLTHHHLLPEHTYMTCNYEATTSKRIMNSAYISNVTAKCHPKTQMKQGEQENDGTNTGTIKHPQQPRQLQDSRERYVYTRVEIQSPGGFRRVSSHSPFGSARITRTSLRLGAIFADMTLTTVDDETAQDKKKSRVLTKPEQL
jgi:hypothetical protein